MEPIANLLLRLGTFLVFVAWLIGSGWLILVFAQDIYSNWGRWQTYPMPDKRATKHLVTLFLVLGAWALFLWLAVVWFGG